MIFCLSIHATCILRYNIYVMCVRVVLVFSLFVCGARYGMTWLRSMNHSHQGHCWRWQQASQSCINWWWLVGYITWHRCTWWDGWGRSRVACVVWFPSDILQDDWPTRGRWSFLISPQWYAVSIDPLESRVQDKASFSNSSYRQRARSTGDGIVGAEWKGRLADSYPQVQLGISNSCRYVLSSHYSLLITLHYINNQHLIRFD